MAMGSVRTAQKNICAGTERSVPKPMSVAAAMAPAGAVASTPPTLATISQINNGWLRFG